MKNYSENIGKKITIKHGFEEWNMYERTYEWHPVTGILEAYRSWTDDYGAVTKWATINGSEYDVTNSSFTINN